MEFRLFRFRSPLLTESKQHIYKEAVRDCAQINMLRVFLSIPLGTKMFQFPRSSSITLYIQVMMICISTNRVSPFGHPRIKACLGAPRGLSHPATSFIVSLCQGIHHMPLAYDSTKAHNVLFLYMSRQKHIK